MSDHHQSLPTVPSYPFRLDVPLHKLLQETPEKHTPESSKEKKTLPTPVFPNQPELFHDLDADDIAAHDQVLQTGSRHWPASRIFKNMRGWMVPYLKSRVLPGDFQPIIAYLFTDWKCNLDCHYCWSYDNRVKGMTEDTARRAACWHPRAVSHSSGRILCTKSFTTPRKRISGFISPPTRACCVRM